MNNTQKQSGFTLIELMVTLAIVATLAVFGVPAYTGFMASRTVDSAVAQVAASAQLARSQAVTLGRSTSICPTSNGLTCTNATSWDKGWMVYLGSGGTVSRVLEVFQSKGVTIVGAQDFTVNPMGLSTGGTTITIVPQSGRKDLGKTLRFENVTMRLTITSGVA